MRDSLVERQLSHIHTRTVLYLDKRREVGLIRFVHDQKLEVFELYKGRCPRLGVHRSPLIISRHLDSV